ncbi:unnamed protein product [Rotaria socialis]|uniref:Protein NO VEIN C-terminal domain-containing protein n=1 Tax=Rotaria socialis TaxID=392032 RepID=A0A821LNR8_9BILA|nr:unnamed protein product [Rotaria socialis]
MQNMYRNVVRGSFQIQHISSYKQQVSCKVAEIIANIHRSKEFVSRERVQSELFNFYHVNSWRRLDVHPGELKPLVNLTDRLKKVAFYMQIFEQVFMLCTLHDIGSILARFIKVDTYEDALLGPLSENPDVKRVFCYEPTRRHQPIPLMTSGDVISLFIDFRENSKGNVVIGNFLDALVNYYHLRTRKELGLYCKSFPYLIEVSGLVKRNSRWYIKEIQTAAVEELTSTIEERLSELKQEMRDELELSAYNKKKSPIAVFNHLASTVEKYLSFIPEQTFTYATLIHLRQNELLQWLLNISIYLGSIQKPETFIAELQRILGHQNHHERQQILTQFYQSLPSDPDISERDHQRLEAMIQQQQNRLTYGQYPSAINDWSHSVTNTSGANAVPPTNPNRKKLTVDLKQLCSYLFEILIKYENAPTIKQLLQIENHLCTKYRLDSFAELKFDTGDDDDDTDTNIVSFLNTHQKLIDPNSELSVYGYNVPITDRRDLFEFTNQLIESNSDKQHISSQSVELHMDSNNEDIQINADRLSILEKAIVHKFGGLLGFRSGRNILHKTKKSSHLSMTCSIIRFEESLLDFNHLDRIDTCPLMPITDEIQLCKFILQCPIMTNLYCWLQWTYFFEPKYGNMKSFIRKHMYSLQHMLLLETSSYELLRLPSDATLKSFEEELNALRVRSAVGHLCALITCEYGVTARVPLNVYRTSMRTWFIHLQSLCMTSGNSRQPMQYVLDFLTYLPILIGQARLIQEIILVILDDVFRSSGPGTVSARKKIWELADEKQKNKLEIWGCTLDIEDWKNNKKWLEQDYSIEEHQESALQSNIVTSNNSIIQDNTHVPAVPTPVLPPSQSHSNTPEVKKNESNISNQSGFEHIESIRRGFGIDSDLDSGGQSIVKNYQGKLERSLQKLSNDLYSEKGHFVLELIQNADDNQYPSDCLPTLRFVLSDKRILICNNEIGFERNNVEAICDVGTSTKGKHKQGYAGHKGIGFKSVFMVSNRPEIHSKGYHFCFDTVDGTEQIGYIRPIWLNKCEEVLPSANEWTTCIRLPIQRSCRLQEDFDNIQAKLLLFLNRLRRIEIVGQPMSSSDSDQIRIFTRIDHADGKIIELQEKTVKETVKTFWLVVKKVLQVPEDIKEKLREVKCEVHSTTIAIAYPISNLQKLIQQLPLAQPLFAYLPLRSYGFRFILQADFEVPATRQEIFHDNFWNEWLKSEMVQLLPLAYEHFKNLPELLTSLSALGMSSSLAATQVLVYFLKLIPTRNELDPYFNSFVDKSMKILMGIIKLPVAQDDGNGQVHTEWVQASQCVLVKDQFIRKILPQELLLSHFNLYYVPEQLASECSERTLIRLGCASLQFSSIIRLIKELYKQDEQTHSTKTSSIEQIAKWLLCINYIIEQQQQENGQLRDSGTHTEEIEASKLRELKQLKIFPLSGHSQLVSMDEYKDQVILFPLPKTAQYKKPFKIILNDLPRLDERLIEYIEDKFARRYDSIVCLLKKLRIIDKPKIMDIYRIHMQPILWDKSRWSTVSDSVLVAFPLCIYAYLDQFENELEQLRKCMVIKTRSGQFVRLDTPGIIIHLTSAYACTRSLESLISPKHEFTFISDDYINNYRTELFHSNDDVRGFARFLENLGITEFLQVGITETHFINVDSLQNTQWNYLIPELNEMIHQPFTIEDCSCNEFNTLIASCNNIAVDIDLCTKLLIYFDRHHATLSQFYTASIILMDQVKSGRRRPKKGIPSTFYLSLRQHAWIPIEGDQLAKPDDVYCLHPKSETAVFHRYIPHLDQTKLSLNNQDFRLNILGLKEHVLPVTMFEIFMKWSCGFDRDVLLALLSESNHANVIPCPLPETFRQPFDDTIENVRRVYRFLLADNCTRNYLRYFCYWPLVFIPENNGRGYFVFPHQVYWQDSTSLLSPFDDISLLNLNRRISIKRYYDNDIKLQGFFLQEFQITFEPTIDDYFPLLSQILSINNTWRLIKVIMDLSFQQNRQIEIKERCFDLPFIPCMGAINKKAKYSDQPFYPHDFVIAEKLANKLFIIQLPDWALPLEFKNSFCFLFEIKSLADVIQLQVHVDNEQLSVDLFNFFFHSIELVQNFLLLKSFITEERSKYLASIFARLHFVCVDKIQLSYKYETDVVRTETCDTYIDEQAGQFYILKQIEKFEKRYIETMVAFLVRDRVAQIELTSYMMELSRIYHNESTQGLINQRQSIINLEYNDRWTFPNVYSISSSSSSSSEEISSDEEQTEELTEMIEKLMNEPLPEQKAPLQRKIEQDDENNPRCFPAKANAKELTEFSNTTSHPAEHKQSVNVSHSPDSNHITSSSSVSHSSKESDNNRTIKNEQPVKSTAKSTDTCQIQAATVDCSNSTSVEVEKFERIQISTLIGSNPYSLSPSSITINPINNEIDNTLGRKGEELVFRFLKWKYPNAHVKWMNNNNKESGLPYDIEMKINNQIDLIEVKTTGIHDQHTFRISIGEINCLLNHPTNYHIYRVYYSGEPESTKITILSQVKQHLEHKQLALCMTIMQRANEE